MSWAKIRSPRISPAFRARRRFWARPLWGLPSLSGDCLPSLGTVFPLWGLPSLSGGCLPLRMIFCRKEKTAKSKLRAAPGRSVREICRPGRAPFETGEGFLPFSRRAFWGRRKPTVLFPPARLPPRVLPVPARPASGRSAGGGPAAFPARTASKRCRPP